MYIQVTQYDKMQRTFVDDSPQLRVISSFRFEFCYYSVYQLTVCVCLYDDVHFSGNCIQFKNRMYVTFCCLHGKTIRKKCNLKVAFSLNSWIYNIIPKERSKQRH